jgi:hypothetical protein
LDAWPLAGLPVVAGGDAIGRGAAASLAPTDPDAWPNDDDGGGGGRATGWYMGGPVSASAAAAEVAAGIG